MRLALRKALRSVNAGEYPVGALVIKNGKIISKSETKTHRTNDPSAHAELLAIRNASKILQTRKLDNCVLYSTHEPCPMCTTAALFARMHGIIFGTSIKDAIAYALQNPGWEWKWVDIPISTIVRKSNCKSFIYSGFMKKECRKLFRLVNLSKKP